MEIQYPDWYEKRPELIAFVESEIDKPVQWLLIGDNGTGKTALAEIIFDAIVKKNENNHRFSMMGKSAPDIYASYLSAINMTGKEKTEALRTLESSYQHPLVMIDELGGEIDTEASRSFFTNFFCRQYDYFKDVKKGYSIITTNLTTEEIALRYGKKVIDRFCQFYLFIFFEWDSYRLKMKRVKRFNETHK